MKQLRIVTRILLYCIILLVAAPAYAQDELLAPVNYNPYVRPGQSGHSTAKVTALSLPFFEDFTNYDVIPDTTRWIGRQVYVNNTMCSNPVSRGVATFDALSEYGVPYELSNPTLLRYTDSLTSRPIDLSGHTPGDSIYLSFFFQPAGTGFAPTKTDTFMLFFLNKDGKNWQQVWFFSDSASKPFRQAMVPLTDTSFFHAGFQFRFVNKAAISVNDKVWNLDYIRMDAGRNMFDTAVNDVAFTVNPSFILNDYTFMPYRQYLAAPAAERAAFFHTVLRNNYTVPKTIGNYGYTAADPGTGTILSTGSGSGLGIGAQDTAGFSFPVYAATPPVGGIYDRVVFENKCYIDPVSAAENHVNDTIVCNQVFDNYLAYDDGTAEMSYYLNMFPTLPAKIAIEYHLNAPDTIRGMAIYFGRQVPIATYKFFSIAIWRKIAFGSVTKDSLVYQMDNFQPGYADTINKFWIYRLDRPIPMEAGTFYMGTIQPVLTGSDSLYIGLDRNRVGGNHVYFNVLNFWQSSLVDGALMMRPLLGQPISGTSLVNVQPAPAFHIYPNPATTQLHIDGTFAADASYQVTDLPGRVLQTGILPEHKSLDIAALPPGAYLLHLIQADAPRQVQKFIKL